MSAILGLTRTITVPVTVNLSVNGKPKAFEILVEYLRRKRSEATKANLENMEYLNELSEVSKKMLNVSNNEKLTDEEKSERNLKLKKRYIELTEYFTNILRRSIKGWDKVPSTEGGFVDFSTEALEDALEHEGYFEAFKDGLMLSGGKVLAEEAEKNLQAQESTG